MEKTREIPYSEVIGIVPTPHCYDNPLYTENSNNFGEYTDLRAYRRCSSELGVKLETEPRHDYSQDYLTIVPLEDGTFKLSRNAVQYSLDDGETWIELTVDTNSPAISAGSKILWKANLTPSSTYGIGTFSSTGQFNVEGNPMSLLYGDDFKDNTRLNGSGAFTSLFQNCTNLVSAKNLSLPAITLPSKSYTYMFYKCTSLTEIPELPATTLATACYSHMFDGCSSLTTAHELPATTLKTDCYTSMFYNCTSLTEAPELPATTLAENCYSSMFYNCTSLTEAPELPATTLANYCYQYMFNGCTGLSEAPELPATTLAKGCYLYMFYNCSSLTTAPELLAMDLAESCYYGMFKNCISLATAHELPATTLVQYCYQAMFEGCTSLTTAPSILPAKALTNSCYNKMFYGCTSLESAPDLLATIPVSQCYNYMFQGCSNLKYVKCLLTQLYNATNNTKDWLKGVSSSGTFVKNSNEPIAKNSSDKYGWTRGDGGIPKNWIVEDA